MGLKKEKKGLFNDHGACGHTAVRGRAVGFVERSSAFGACSGLNAGVVGYLRKLVCNDVGRIVAVRNQDAVKVLEIIAVTFVLRLSVDEHFEGVFAGIAVCCFVDQ